MWIQIKVFNPFSETKYPYILAANTSLYLKNNFIPLQSSEYKRVVNARSRIVDNQTVVRVLQNLNEFSSLAPCCILVTSVFGLEYDWRELQLLLFEHRIHRTRWCESIWLALWQRRYTQTFIIIFDFECRCVCECVSEEVIRIERGMNIE